MANEKKRSGAYPRFVRFEEEEAPGLSICQRVRRPESTQCGSSGKNKLSPIEEAIS
jgi:hypothetical protein